MKTTINLFLFSFLFSITGFTQGYIEFKNPSFETIPRLNEKGVPFCCVGTKDWFSCGGFAINSPDAQPGNFDIDIPASEGNYYLSMVTRDNETWESTYQKLSAPLEMDKHYSFAVAMAKGKNLWSESRKTGKLVHYKKSIKLRIWGGDNQCEKKELLGESELIDNTTWEYFEFILAPTQTHNYLTLEAFFKTPTLMPYNGNLLIDDCSPIIELDSADSIPEAKEEEKKSKRTIFYSKKGLKKM